MSPSTPTEEPKQGEFRQAKEGDLRTPCPVINALANHGFIPRDGRDMTADQLKAAFRYLGFGFDTTNFLVNGAFSVHADNPKTPEEGKVLGLRDKDQVNEDGVPVLNLDQFARPHAVEHNVSLTREDRELGDPVILRPELLEKFLKCPVNGKGFTSSDLAAFRKERYAEQKAANPKLNFPPNTHQLACGEIGAFQGIFGKGLTYEIPKEYVQAMFGEDRLPYTEGWVPRKTPFMFPELYLLMTIIQKKADPF